MKKAITFFILFNFMISGSLKGQENYINPDGFNRFFYPNGQISSEGYMKKGKPDGYWRTYYVTGVTKSEGNRKNHFLDSIWVFYNQAGDTLQKINYLYGNKNGFYYTYSYENKNYPEGYIYSKELFLNDKKEGKAYYYYGNKKVKMKINYLNGEKSGRAFEYSENGKIITLLEYHKDRLISRERINRIDEKDNKHGVWKEFYENGKVSIEKVYESNYLEGYYKKYDRKGNLILTLRYKKGKLVENDVIDEQENIELRKKYDKDGNLIYSGPYKKNIPIGIHREYSRNGEVINSKIYDNLGRVVSIGIVNEKGEKQENWKNYYGNGNLRSEGKYMDNKKFGNWKYYFKNRNIEQTGKYRNDKPDELWKWYYNNGKLRKEEEYFIGKRDGIYIEYSESGDVISEGYFLEGEMDGNWKTKVGDHSEEGKYIVGLKNGIWKYYYDDESLKYKGKFVNGNPDGRHQVFWENGNMKEERYYENGYREKTWKKYNKDGYLVLTITFKDDQEYRVNGVKLKLPESEVKLIK